MSRSTSSGAAGLTRHESLASTFSGVSDCGRKHVAAPSKPVHEETPLFTSECVDGMCTMCEAAPIEFSCADCGRLSFCGTCALSLHDNKFLGFHELRQLNSDCVMTVVEIRASHGKKSSQVTKRAASPSISAFPKRFTSKAPAKEKTKPTLKKLDLVAHTNDRRVLASRAQELRQSSLNLRQLGANAAEEKQNGHDSSRAACAAIKKRFDAIRQALDAKEAECFKYIDAVGRERLDEATKTVGALNAAAAEAEAAADFVGLQLDRLEGNNEYFEESRRALLEETSEQLEKADSNMIKLKSQIATVRAMPLGCCATGIDDALAASLSIHVGTRGVAVKPARAVETQSFLNQPGVKVFSSSGGHTPRKTMAEEVAELISQSPRQAKSPRRVEFNGVRTPRQNPEMRVIKSRYMDYASVGRSRTPVSRGVNTPLRGTPIRGSSPAISTPLRSRSTL